MRIRNVSWKQQLIINLDPVKSSEIKGVLSYGYPFLNTIFFTRTNRRGTVREHCNNVFKNHCNFLWSEAIYTLHHFRYLKKNDRNCHYTLLSGKVYTRWNKISLFFDDDSFFKKEKKNNLDNLTTKKFPLNPWRVLNAWVIKLPESINCIPASLE